MKYVAKAGASKIYQDWRRTVKGQPNEHYNSLQNPEKENLHSTLIAEQGALCAYTMRRIGLSTSHIEHIKPETVCRTETRGSDLDYSNMLACFPRDGMNSNYRYGAQAKDNWWEDNGAAFVSPLNQACENLLVFNKKGEIRAYQNNPNAVNTIEVLKLDHGSLTEDRKRAIEEFIYGPSGSEMLSPKQASTLISQIHLRNGAGEFVEFCIAIRYALIDYLSMLQKIAAKKKFVQKPKK